MDPAFLELGESPSMAEGGRDDEYYAPRSAVHRGFARALSWRPDGGLPAAWDQRTDLLPRDGEVRTLQASEAQKLKGTRSAGRPPMGARECDGPAGNRET